MVRKTKSEVRQAVSVRNVLGETPVWAEDEQALYWINCEGPSEVLRWDTRDDEIRRWPMPERCGGIVLKRTGGALVTLASGLYDLDFETGDLESRVASPLSGPVALHECACDPTGRFWVGSIDHRVGPENLHPGGAALFRLDGSELISVIEGISCANGLAFAPDGRTLYISDSTTQRCDAYDLDPVSGAISGGRTFFQLGPADGFVDGATVDAEGGYWATLVYAGKVRRYLPDGTLDIEIELPFDNPTKPAFGGPDLRTVFVTSTSQSLTGAVNPLDGGLFAFETEFPGRPEPRFDG